MKIIRGLVATIFLPIIIPGCYITYSLFGIMFMYVIGSQFDKEEREEGRKMLVFILASPFIHWYQYTIEGKIYGL